MTPFRSETPEDLIAPACRPTVDRLQLVLDGELEANAIDTDLHPRVCAACRERIAAARLVLSVLGTTEVVAIPSGMTERIVDAVREDRYSRIRRRSYAAVLGIPVALAASLALVAWFTDKPEQPNTWNPEVRPVARNPEVAPPPREVARVKPLRIGDELTRAGQALRETPKAITEPAAAAPEVFAKLTNALTQPIAPMPDDMEPARSALAELPDVALSGLEPLTDTAQKAFSRLMRDVGAVSVKPKS